MEKKTLQEKINVHESDHAAKDGITEDDGRNNVADDPARNNKKPGDHENAKPQGRSFVRKWTLLIIAGAILAVSGLGIKFGPGFLKMGDSEIFVNADIHDANLSEEALSPFFIPPGRGNPEGAIRIDLSVVWDGLASVRYRKRELQVRSVLYSQLAKIAEENDDLSSRVSFLENRISAVFRESLGAGTLVVRVKEIRYI